MKKITGVPMKKITNLASRELKWTQPRALKSQYELHAGDELVATLVFRSSFGSFATAKTADGCWTFKRTGFISTNVTIRECNDKNADVATFRNNTWSGGGTLELPDGRTYRANTNFWKTRYSFSTPSNETLIEFKTKGFIHDSAEVEISPQAASIKELPFMVCLGGYLAIMMRKDSSSAAGGAAAAGG